MEKSDQKKSGFPKKLKRHLGLEKRGSYIDTFFDRANFRSSIFMSVVIIVLELWMIASLLWRWINGDPTRTQSWFVSHLIWYIIFLVTACFMLLYAVSFLKGKYRKRLPGKLLMVVFSGIALYFGISISYSDYIRGEQILCFVMMVIFAVGLLNWRPVAAISLSTFVFVLFYLMMERAPEVTMTYATRVNFFNLWITIIMLSLAVYSQRLSEAEKDERLEYSARVDELTGIPNMPYFRKRAGEILLTEDPEKMLFLFLDISNFKAFNEKHGYDAGNELIRSTAAKIRERFSKDLYARISDDHFVILTERENIEARIKALTEAVKEDHLSTQLSLKSGGYTPSSKTEDPSIACDHARYACSEIKKDAGCFYCEYDKKMDESFHKRHYIITQLEEAIRNGYIQVYYQPVVRAKDRSICGAEALARWIDPNYRFLSPGDFIPALEEYRLIHRLDREILEQVCRDIHAASSAGRRVIPISVNFSRLDFELTDVKGDLEELIGRYDIPPGLIHVEITESTLSADDEKLKKTVSSIKGMGIQLWLDDFGSGYSSLNVLKEYSFDMLKIDMVFLRHFKENSKAKAILSSIVNMAGSIGIDALTEGVEEEEQAAFLEEIGCGRLQGYLFGKPMPLENLRNQYHCF